MGYEGTGLRGLLMVQVRGAGRDVRHPMSSSWSHSGSRRGGGSTTGASESLRLAQWPPGWCHYEGSSHSNKSEQGGSGSKRQPPFPLTLSSPLSQAQAQAEAAGGGLEGAAPGPPGGREGSRTRGLVGSEDGSTFCLDFTPVFSGGLCPQGLLKHPSVSESTEPCRALAHSRCFIRLCGRVVGIFLSGTPRAPASLGAGSPESV